MAEHIKWQKTANKNYMGAWDLPDDGKDLLVTIEDVKEETLQNERGTEKKQAVHFKGEYKPLILNTTNMKAIAKACGTDYMDEWCGHNIQLYKELVSAFGTTTEAVRVRDFAPSK